LAHDARVICSAAGRSRNLLITRLAKIAMCLSLAAFCLLVAFDNIFDPHPNYIFITHVMSMDATFPDSTLKYRSVTSPVAWQVIYMLIIGTQIVAGFLFLLGSLRMWQARYAAGVDFNRAKTYAIGGALVAFLLWFFVFTVVAGEWFAMWQSEDWNAQQASFRIYVTVLAVLIFLNHQDIDLPERS
jgi:predicted small integral membrane protein